MRRWLPVQRGIQAATAALQGLAGGNIAGALAEASAPVLANIIDHHAGINDDIAAKAIAHAILGSVTTAHKGNGVRIRSRSFEKQSDQEAQTAPSTDHRTGWRNVIS